MEHKYSLTTELKRIFNYIKQNLIKEYPTNNITLEYFILGVLNDTQCIGYQLMERVVLSETMDTLYEWFLKRISQMTPSILETKQPLFDNNYDSCIKNISKTHTNIDSGLLLLETLKSMDDIKNKFKSVGISYEHLNEMYNEHYNVKKDVVLVKKDVKNITLKTNKTPKITTINTGEVEKFLINLNKLSTQEKIDNIVGNDEIYKTIFRILSKKEKNNIVLVGEPGVGKTSIVKHIANLLTNNKTPHNFHNKVLMQMDFSDLIMGTGFRGVFETKIKSIIEDAKKKGCYIFFIDDIQSVLNENTKFGEIDISVTLSEILKEPNILFICTTNHKSYNKYIHKNPYLKRNLTKLVINEPTTEHLQEIIEYKKNIFSDFHNVNYTNEAIQTAIKLTQQHITDIKTPDSVIDILDECGSMVNMQRGISDKLKQLKQDYEDIIFEKESIILNTSNQNDLDLYDKLTKKEISLKSQINIIERDEALSQIRIDVTEDVVKSVVSKKTNVPLTQLNSNERVVLKNLEENLKEKVIGQEEAISKVCNVVKRQRIGISDPQKPPVLLFAGSTGTGKTYLTKKLTKELFGDEKYMIRLDMSEYIDKTSTNKLIGAAAGYIGYDNGGVLTEAVKKNKHCVLLLDEIEKANEDVHNMFLQLFDEGRMTDNTGEVVDFRNCIIIMTSNVGAKEVDERGNCIGFNVNNDFSNEIINKTLRKTFKPEFINRINSIVYFNKLEENEYKQIIKLEINKIQKRINDIGYEIDNTITETLLPQKIINNVLKHKKYGARPIIRELQHLLEDKITDYIINNDPPKGFVFNYEHINN